MTNQSSVAPTDADALVLRNQHGNPVAAIPDMIWDAWMHGTPESVLGEYEVTFPVPPETYQRVGDELALVQEVGVKVHVFGLVQQLVGSLQGHQLRNMDNNTIERGRINAQFPPPSPGRFALRTLATEEELQGEIAQPAAMKITNRIRLPRLNFGQAYYWPPSERVTQIITERMQAFEAGQIPDPRPFDIAELEGTNFETIFEPISPKHPAGRPLVTTD